MEFTEPPELKSKCFRVMFRHCRRILDVVFVVFVEYWVNFGVSGLHLQPRGHQLAFSGLPGSVLERLGVPFRSRWVSLGDPMGPYQSFGWCILRSLLFSLF